MAKVYRIDSHMHRPTRHGKVRKWPSKGLPDNCEGNYSDGDGVHYMNEADYGCRVGDSVDTPFGTGTVVDVGYHTRPFQVVIDVQYKDGGIRVLDRNDVYRHKTTSK